MRAEKKKRPPTFSHYVDIDVDIDPEDLERAGWRYVGKDDDDADALPDETVLDVVERWHCESHDGPWRFCDDSLCDELRGRRHDGRN